jgi:probable HAF family extracellular repeat protein
MQNSQSVQLAMFAMIVFGGVETALANPIYSFTTIDVPGANGITAASGINDNGQIVGYFRDALAFHGFLDTGDSFTTLDGPDECFGLFTEAYGINNIGQIVGIESTSAVNNDGFVYTDGNFTIFDVPGAGDTVVRGINDSGQIVGYFNFGHGFVDTGGIFTTIDVPGATGTPAYGINNSGQIVGSFGDASGVHGFVYTDGNFTTLDVPGATRTTAFGINNGGQIVGSFTDATGTHGFVYTGGSFTTIDIPGAISTNASGINDSGQIVGYFQDATGEHGFLASPVPE